MNLSKIIKISRPRFWLYAGGTFLVGLAAGASSLQSLLSVQWILYFLYFILPANIFIYGINDLYDDDTDAFNSKKDDKEHRLQIAERKFTKIFVWFSAILGIIVAITSPTWQGSALVLVSVFLAWAYSSKPFRFKAKPFIDAISNVHYAVIGFAAYAMASGHWPPLWAVLAAWFWTASMHIFSAVPDIEADLKANLKTTAIFFGFNKSLVVTSLLWLGTTICLFVGNFHSPYSIIASLLYVIMPLLLINSSHQRITKVYWYYPIINAVYGLVLFWILAFPKI